MNKFQSTLPYGSDEKLIKAVNAELISIHAPLRERRCAVRCWRSNSYFNPRSLTGATTNPTPVSVAQAISIHAPLRERQEAKNNDTFTKKISIHAPLRERPVGASITNEDYDFNPRSLTGATKHRLDCFNRWQHFNPRSLTGATAIRISLLYAPRIFQSTLPYGSDSAIGQYSAPADLFQSTLPYGSDHFQPWLFAVYGISIHAPLRERPFDDFAGACFTLISIHAPLRERL